MVVKRANEHPFLTALALSTLVAIAGLAAVTREGRQRANDLRQEQAEDARVLAREQLERDRAVIRICETFARRVELTFTETYDALEQRAVEVGRPAPQVYAELTLIAEKNLAPSFCSPSALEEPTTTNP